jgi:hypothetical protein
MVMMIANQAKNVSYCDRCLEDDFIPLVVKIFGCFYQQNDDFFHQCVNMAQSMKGFGGPFF